MAGSIFSKLRKEAKVKKSKDDVGMTTNEVVVARKVKEVEPVTPEELNVLLSSLDESMKTASDIVDVVRAPVPSTINVHEVDVPQIFEAYGVYYDASKKKFMKISLDYDPVSCYSKVNKIEELTDSKAIAVAKMAQVFSLKLMRVIDTIKGDSK